MNKYFLMQDSCGCSISTYATEVIFGFHFWIPHGTTLLIRSKTVKSRKRVGSWRYRQLCHIHRPCSWRQRHRLLDRKWQRPQPRFRHFSNVFFFFLKQIRRHIDCKIAASLFFYSITIDNARDASSFGVPVCSVLYITCRICQDP